MSAPPRLARELFAPLGSDYERWARVLSFGQDGRWRRTMVDGLPLEPGSLVLDVAAGTGSITRALEERGSRVVALDQSREMLAHQGSRGRGPIVATAERLPFADGSFDAVTFGYLLRYVDDVEDAMREIHRVLRSGGSVGMVEFGRPRGVWGPLWWLYTRIGLPVAGRLIGAGWWRVGRFLGPSIDGFARRFPPDRLAAVWTRAGFTGVTTRRLSLGGGLVMWARKP